MENKSGYGIKALRFDRGSKFTSKEFCVFCQSHGIHLPLTAPRLP